MPHHREQLFRQCPTRRLFYWGCTAALAATLLLTGCSAPDGPTSAQPATGDINLQPPLDAHADNSDTDDWRPLFNGRTLTGWTTSVGAIDAWGAQNDELVTPRPGAGDWLFTKDKFTDYELTLEFFLPPRANSGVGLRVADVGDPGYGGYEIQLVDSAGQAPTLRNAGAIFDIAPANVMAIHPPNQWNTLRVKLVDQTLDVWLNGKRIHESLVLPQLPDRDPFTSGEETTGRISLQDNGGSVRYRNIQIRLLTTASDGVFSLDQLDRR